MAPKDECNVTMALLNHPAFITLITAEIIVGVLGSIGSAVLLVALWKMRLFHINLRILLIHTSLLAICYSLATSTKAAYTLVIWRLDPCRFVITLYDCKLRELVMILPLLATIYSLISIGVERLYATCTFSTYERSSNIGLSAVLIGLAWIFPLLTQIPPLWSVSRTEVIPFCVNLLVMSKSTAFWMLILACAQEVTALTLFAAAYFINKKLYAASLTGGSLDQSLSGRFQLAQNIHVSQTMLRTAAAHATFILPTIALAVLVVTRMDIDFTISVQLVHVAYLSTLIHTVAHPVLWFARNAALRNAIAKFIPCWKKRGSVSFALTHQHRIAGEYRVGSTANESDKHFEILLRSWRRINK